MGGDLKLDIEARLFDKAAKNTEHSSPEITRPLFRTFESALTIKVKF
jgi:hypothetical protein